MNTPEPGPGGLSEEEREAIKAAHSDWALESEYPRPHRLDRIYAAVERILADRARRPADEGLRAAVEELAAPDGVWKGAKHVRLTRRDRTLGCDITESCCCRGCWRFSAGHWLGL